MNKLIFLLFIICGNSVAQNNSPTTVASGLPEGIFNLAFHNNDIYFTKAFNGNNNIGKVTPIVSSTAYQIVLSNITQPYGIVVNNNMLYYSEYGPQKISKIDLTQQTYISEQLPILFSEDGPWALRVYDNALLYSEAIMNIKRVPLTNPSLNPELLITYTLHPFDFIKIDNYIYATEEGMGNDRIIRMNLLETFPPEPTQVASIYKPSSLAKIDNYLFVLSNENSIYKIDLNQINSTPTLFYSTISTGGLMGHIRENNNELYFTLNEQSIGGSIKKFSHSQLSTENFDTNNSVTIFPNPVSNTLTIQNIEIDGEVVIYDATGKLIMSKTTNQNSVDVSNLCNGLYFLELNNNGNKTIKKFVKY